jgi:outer membrane cobalamin receptor
LLVLFAVALSSARAQLPDDKGLLTITPSTFYNDSTQQSKPGLVAINGLELSKSAGTYYVVTRQEIEASGARDLMELLNLLPGIQLGTSADQLSGAGIRGMWAGDNRYQVLLNGMPLNEMAFGTFGLGRRMVPDNIEFIEVVLGTGPAKVGGTATLGTINLVTFSPGSSDGSSLSTSLGATREGVSWMNATAQGNHYLGNETFGSYYISLLGGPRSNRFVSNTAGLQGNLKDSTQTVSNEIFFAVRHKGLSAQFFNNDYSFDVAGSLYKVSMRNVIANINYAGALGRRDRITTSLVFHIQEPWSFRNTNDFALIEANTSVQRYAGDVQYDAEIARWCKFSGGLQGNRQVSRHQLLEGTNNPSGPGHEGDAQAINMLALYGRFHLTVKRHNLLASLRGDVTNIFRPALTPRVNYQFISRYFFLKAGIGMAMRLPTLENLHPSDLAPAPLPEHNLSRSFTLGFTPAKTLYADFTAFSHSVNNAIIRMPNDTAGDYFINRPGQAVEGYECNLKFTRTHYFIKAGLTWHRAISDSAMLPEAWAPGEQHFLALAARKATLLAGYQPNAVWSFGLTFIWLDRITTCETVQPADPAGTTAYVTRPSSLNGSLNLSYTERKNGQWKFSFLISNILDKPLYLGSPYADRLPSLPLNGREYTLRICYQITK